MKVVRPPALTEQKYRTTRGITGGTLIDIRVISLACFCHCFPNKSTEEGNFSKKFAF